ncbi:hypothetical protein [Solimicrobium silvestre]|uniref:Uncharacterized protein n=1 Tax=Solimicrobium silvestre TaxID=2099400 RepID=A0A2S9GV32_9BURK|nr:hypothetical protein [Solimicrobium silvestre]PRC91579.1 hypothetical protein S2091_3695 [Solimicrobium silvestre]
MLITLLLKLLLVPTLIGLVTLSGRRWGPKIAGWLSAFPIVAGPILFFIALDQGNQFAIIAATSTLSAVLAIIVFGLAYVWAAVRLNWIGSLAVALFFYTLAVLGLKLLSLSLYAAAIASVLAIIAAPRLYPKVISRPSNSAPSRFDLPLRMSAGAVLAVSVTYFAPNLGPRLTGIFAMFPVMSLVLTVFSHRSEGREFATNQLRGMLFGWYAFATFCFTLALLLPTMEIAVAFLIATTAALIVQLGSRRFVV